MSDVRIQNSVSNSNANTRNTTAAKESVGRAPGQKTIGTDFSRILGMSQVPAQGPQSGGITPQAASNPTSHIPAHAVIAVAVANGMQVGNQPRRLAKGSKLQNDSTSGVDDSSPADAQPTGGLIMESDASLNDPNGVFASIVGMAQNGSAPAQMMIAQRQMAELNQGLNTQYLMLQQMLQQENREYNTLSNVLKAKTDSVKGVLKNIA